MPRTDGDRWMTSPDVRGLTPTGIDLSRSSRASRTSDGFPAHTGINPDEWSRRTTSRYPARVGIDPAARREPGTPQKRGSTSSRQALSSSFHQRRAVSRRNRPSRRWKRSSGTRRTAYVGTSIEALRGTPGGELESLRLRIQAAAAVATTIPARAGSTRTVPRTEMAPGWCRDQPHGSTMGYSGGAETRSGGNATTRWSPGCTERPRPIGFAGGGRLKTPAPM